MQHCSLVFLVLLRRTIACRVVCTVPNPAPNHISLPKDLLVTCSKMGYVKTRRVLKIVSVIAMRRMNGCISYGWWW